MMTMALIVFLGSVGNFEQVDRETLIAEVQHVLDVQVADWNRRDLDGFCRGYWNSPKLTFQSGGTKTVGWEAMKKRYKARYQSEGKEMGTLAFEKVEVEPLGPESALARGRWELTMSDGTKVGGLFTVVVRKFPQGWKIIHDHTSSDEK